MALRTYAIHTAAAGLNFYSVIVRQSDGYKYNHVSEAFEVNPTAVQSGFTASEVGDTIYKLQVPDTIAGNMSVVLYQRVGGGNDFSADTYIKTLKGSLGGIFGV